jgi:predicted branched-subunit amino acid permease
LSQTLADVFFYRMQMTISFLSVVHELWPNKSLEPTAVGAGSSVVAVHVTSRRWLSFIR